MTALDSEQRAQEELSRLRIALAEEQRQHRDTLLLLAQEREYRKFWMVAATLGWGVYLAVAFL